MRGKRRALGLTEDQLATALGVTRREIEDYERGLQRVPPDHLIRLSQLFGVPMAYFFPATPCPDSPI